MNLWWIAYPGRLEREEDALRADRIAVERDSEAFDAGFLKLRLVLPPGYWPATELIAIYPDSYPYTRPEIFAPSLTLDHHQNPALKNLCLLPRSSEHWPPTWTVADLLREQLPKLKRALEAEDRAQLAQVEIEQGEPFTAWFDYEEESIVVIDSSMAVPDSPYGFFALAQLDAGIEPLRGRVGMITDHAAKSSWSTLKADEEDDALPGMWIRTPRPTLFRNADALFSELMHERAELAKAPWKKGVQVVALIFQDELGHRTDGLGWVCLVRRRGEGKGGKHRAKSAFVRVDRAGISDLAARFPGFRDLQRCGIAVVGLGCVGAPSAIEFARSGIGRLHMLDDDVVEAGTTVRWPLGLTVAGRRKAKVLFDTISRDYPWVGPLRAHTTRLGALPDRKPNGEREALTDLLNGVDLLYDATGETGLQYLLSTLARDRNLPYVCVSGTRGARGGIVARFNHRAGSGCWWCFQAALDRVIPSPHADEAADVQPAGCGRVTYVGANFDMMEVSLQGVRLAVSTLLARRGQDELDYRWDVAVVNLTDERGRRTEPRWTVYDLQQNIACPVCHS